MTRWKEDLVREIRYFDKRDHLDRGWSGEFGDDIPSYNVTVRDIEGTDFSLANRTALARMIKKFRPQSILEIGIENNLPGLTSTSVILANKLPECRYLGVDLLPRNELDNPDNNVYTLQCDSSNYAAVYNKLDEIGIDKIDFIFIDGWHSIGQVLTEWEYVSRLSEFNGLVGFHDTAYHPGPYLFMNNLDKTKWIVSPNVVDDPNDYGIGFAWKK